MNTLISRNSPQIHLMHRQLTSFGGIQKIPGNVNCSPTQPEETLHLKVQPRTNATAAVRRKPFQNDVICARGRTYWDHPGNQLYRKLISLAKNQYSKAPNRLGKSLIVSEIIRHIHQANGRFIKKVNRKGGEKWVECSVNFVREKVTQSLRDGLSFKYSSSTERKRQRKAQSQEIFHGDIDRIVHSNTVVSQKISDFKQKVAWMNRYHGTENEPVSDESIMEIFEAANLDLLETMKKHPSMLDELRRVSINESPARRSDEDGSIRSLSPASNGSRTPPMTMLLHSESAPQTLLSQSPNTSSDTTRIMNINLSLPPSTASTNILQRGRHENINNVCYDDMDLDFESPFTFLDEMNRYRTRRWHGNKR